MKRTITIDMGLAAIVPVNPTPTMCAAGFVVNEAEHDPSGVYRAMLTVSPSYPTGVVEHSGEPSAWWAKATGAFYLSEESMRRDVKERNHGVTELFTHPPEQPDIKALKARIDELEVLNDQLHDAIYAKTLGFAFSNDHSEVFIDGFGMIPIGTINKWQEQLEAQQGSNT